MTRVLIPPVTAAPQIPSGALLAMGGPTMGTSWSAKVVSDHHPEVLRQGVQACLDEVVAQMSNWEPASDLSRYNAAAPGSWLALPQALFDVVSHGLALAEDSGGAFDPAAGALVDLWGFGAKPASGAPPSGDAIRAAREAGDWRKLRLDPAVRGAFQPGGLQLDLSGIAKGYGVDAAADFLRGAPVTSFLIEVGGELRGQGVKPDGQPWWVALETAPDAAEAPPIRAALHDLSIATSGDYRRFFDHGGQTYGHTLNPRSGRPIRNDLVSVSVLHPCCMTADALATALLVLGAEEGLAFAASRGVAARLMGRAGSGVGEILTPAMLAMTG